MSELRHPTDDPDPDPTPDPPPPPPSPEPRDRPTPEPDSDTPQPAPAPPEGSWEGRGRHLTPEQNALADRELAIRREVERALTPTMRQVAADLGDAELVGLKDARKGEERFKEKLAAQIARHPEVPPERLAAEIHDGVRYTLVFADDHYTAGVARSCERLAREGYELVLCDPRWSDQYYRGVNSRWMDMDGNLFEVQFHTPESYAAKRMTHEAYERRVDPRVPEAEKQHLARLEREINEAVPIPPGALEIERYERGL